MMTGTLGIVMWLMMGAMLAGFVAGGIAWLQCHIERIGELPGPVADQEPEVRSAITEIHQEIPGLLRGSRSVRVRGDPEDTHIAGTDLDHEQAVQTPESHRAVHVEEIGGEHRRGLGIEETGATSCRCGASARGESAGP